MAGKDALLKWSQTAASNTDVANIGIQGTNLPSNFDNALREIMKEIADGITRHVTKTVGTYTAALTDHNQFWRCTGAVEIDLTAAATLTTGWCLWIRANGGAVTIDPNGSETIDGSATSLVLADGQQALIICTGTAFFTVMNTSILTQPALTLKQGTAPTAEGDIQWNATTNAILVGDAAATKTFRASSWETISETTFSSAASWAATSLSAFRKLRITGNMIPATDAQALYLRTDANNGASYDAGASDYNWQAALANANVFTGQDSGATTEIRINGSFTVGNATGEGISFCLNIEDFNQAAYMFLSGKVTTMRDTGIMYTGTVAGRRLQATARDAIQIFFASGNIASGHLVLEGVRG